MDTQTVALISIGCTLLGAALAVLTFNRNRDKDVREDASKSAVLETKLDNISRGVDDIKIDLKANEKQMVIFGERMVKVEESVKSAHKRIDAIENKEEL